MKKVIIILCVIWGFTVLWYTFDINQADITTVSETRKPPSQGLSENVRHSLESTYAFTTNFSESEQEIDIVLEPQYVDWFDEKGQMLSYQKDANPFFYNWKLWETLNVTVNNLFWENTSVHWHGIRVSNHEDGVPILTQDVIQKDQKYNYRITLNDPWLFWFHPHANHEYQIGKWLYGLIYVPSKKEEYAEKQWFKRDFEENLALKDFRVDQQGNLSESLGTMHDRTHWWMIGNFQTTNNVPVPEYTLKKWYGVIRLVNTSNARYYTINLDQFDAYIIGSDWWYMGKDYQEKELLIAPGERYFVAINTTNLSEKEYVLYDTFYDQNIALARFRIEKGDSIENKISTFKQYIDYYLEDIPDWSTLQYEEPDQHILLWWRWVMGGSESMMWWMSQERWRTIDNLVVSDNQLKTIDGYEWREGELRVVRITNNTRRVHPMHLHGDFFQVIARSDKGQVMQWRKDTVNVEPWHYVDIAVIPTNPWKWLFHCHILWHAALWMKTVVNVLGANEKDMEVWDNDTSLSVSEVKYLMKDDNVILLDIRTPDEQRKTGVLSWSQMIDFYDPSFESKIKTLSPDKKYILYCRSWNRSKQARTIMREWWYVVNDMDGWILERDWNTFSP